METLYIQLGNSKGQFLLDMTLIAGRDNRKRSFNHIGLRFLWQLLHCCNHIDEYLLCLL